MEYKTKELGILLEDTFETYYWIGFLLADGTFYKEDRGIGLCLGKRDEEHLLKFREYVKSDCVVTVRKSKGTFDSSNSILQQIWVGYKNVVPEIMDKFGIHPRKTYNPPSIPIIKDDDLFISLFIGFIDGDGSICKTNTNYSEIRIKIHKSWDILLKSFICRLYTMVGLISPKGRYVLDKYYSGNIGNSIVIKLLKNKALELKLPILKKWDKIDLNFVSTKETSLFKKKEVIYNFEQGKTPKEISNIVKLDYSCVCRILKKLKE